MSQLHGAYPEDVDASAFHIGSLEQDPLDPDNIPAASYVQMWARYVIDTGEFVDPAAQDEIALGNLAGARLTRAFVQALAAPRAGDSKRLRSRHADRSRMNTAGAPMRSIRKSTRFCCWMNVGRRTR